MASVRKAWPKGKPKGYDKFLALAKTGKPREARQIDQREDIEKSITFSVPNAVQVLETLHDMGAPSRILVDGKPHLGTDNLVKILKRFRATLIEAGAVFRYSTCVEDLIIEDNTLKGLTLRRR